MEVKAEDFIKLVQSGKKEQSSTYGKWFSSKASGKQLISTAEERLKEFKKYVEYLEAVVQLNPSDLDAELRFKELEDTLEACSPASREKLLQKYRTSE